MMRLKASKLLLPLAFGLLFTPLVHSAHAAGLTFARHKIQGQIIDNRYYGYGDSFSIALPATSDASQIDDFYAAPNLGGVAFFNDYGFLLKIEEDALIPEVECLIKKHPDIKEEMLDALFHDALFPQIKHSVPALQLVFEKKITLPDGQPALFAVLDMPEAATLQDIETGRGLDSKRGYLIFFARDTDLFTFSLQDTLSFIPSIAIAAKARLNDRLLNHLLHYYGTFKLESGKREPVSKFPETAPTPHY